MKKNLFKILPIVAALMFATSCSKDKEDNTPLPNNTPAVEETTDDNNNSSTEEPTPNDEEDTPPTEDPTPEIVEYKMAFKANFASSFDKISLTEDTKSSVTSSLATYTINFADVDNLVTATVNLSAANFKEDGETAEFEVTFNGEKENLDKFKAGEISLLASIGSEITAINTKSYSSLDDAMQENSYYVSKEEIKYSESPIEISFEQKTAFLEIFLTGNITTVDINSNDYTLTYGGVVVALPTGTQVTSEALNLNNIEIDAADIFVYSPNSFSVSATKKVHFAPGNLQYNILTSEWRFAVNQYDKCFIEKFWLGEDFNAIVSCPNCWSSDYGLISEGWTDLFGWGRWIKGQDPSKTPLDDENYFSNLDNDGDILTGESYMGADWELLTINEWDYLFNQRDDASDKYGVATITNNDVTINGLVVLPDNWTAPSDVVFTPGMSQNAGKNYYVDKGNTYTTDQWAKMEAAGAVFLPTTGSMIYHGNQDTYIDDYEVNNIMYQKSTAYYWSATSGGYRDMTTDASYSRYSVDGNTDWYYSYMMQFTSKGVYVDNNNKSRRHYGSAVRLVRSL